MQSHMFILALLFFHIYSTSENIAVYIWDQLKVSLGSSAGLLYEVSLHETENNTFIYRGEWSMYYSSYSLVRILICYYAWLFKLVKSSKNYYNETSAMLLLLWYNHTSIKKSWQKPTLKHYSFLKPLSVLLTVMSVSTAVIRVSHQGCQQPVLWLMVSWQTALHTHHQ